MPRSGLRLGHTPEVRLALRTSGAAFLVAAGLALVPVADSGSAPVAAAVRAECSAGTVSLTFDDGPASELTSRLVRILRQAGVPATFFMVGQRVDSAPGAAQQVERAGFLVGNHSFAHEDLTGLSSEAVRSTVRRTDASLRRVGVHPLPLMRPPYGAIDGRVAAAIRSTGHVPVLWDVDPRDWESGTADQIAARILGGLRPHGSNIVLQHDGVGNSPASIAAVPQVIRTARARGYCFVALDEEGRPGFPTPVATLSLRPADRRVTEGRPAAAVVRLSGPAGRDTTVRLTVSAGTARSDLDYTRPARSIVIPAGRLSAQVRIPVLRDRLDEPTEGFGLRLAEPAGVRLGGGPVQVIVLDADPEPRVSLVDTRVAEPASGSVAAPITLRLDRVSGRDVRVRVRTEAGTAGADDYSALDRWVLVPAGTATVPIPVTVLADSVVEPDETFTLRVVGTRYARGSGAATVTITAPAPAP